MLDNICGFVSTILLKLVGYPNSLSYLYDEPLWCFFYIWSRFPHHKFTNHFTILQPFNITLIWIRIYLIPKLNCCLVGNILRYYENHILYIYYWIHLTFHLPIPIPIKIHLLFYYPLNYYYTNLYQISNVLFLIHHNKKLYHL